MIPQAAWSLSITSDHLLAGLALPVTNQTRKTCRKPVGKAVGAAFVVAAAEVVRQDLVQLVVEPDAPSLATAGPSSGEVVWGCPEMSEGGAEDLSHM